jgi:hypothetical protein
MKKILLQNQQANFKQTCYKLYSAKGIQNFSNKGPGPLQRGDNHKNACIGWGNLKIFFLQSTG